MTVLAVIADGCRYQLHCLARDNSGGDYGGGGGGGGDSGGG